MSPPNSIEPGVPVSVPLLPNSGVGLLVVEVNVFHSAYSLSALEPHGAVESHALAVAEADVLNAMPDTSASNDNFEVYDIGFL
jgi:hypothetical protein